VALLRAEKALDKAKVSGDEKIGLDIVRRALEEPIRQIAENAGVEGSIVVQKVKDGTGAFGFNAETERTRICSKPGSSILPKWPAPRWRTPPASPASCDDECLVTEVPEKEKKGGPPAPPKITRRHEPRDGPIAGHPFRNAPEEVCDDRACSERRLAQRTRFLIGLLRRRSSSSVRLWFGG